MAIQKILVVLGPPGSGKGTQSSRMAKRMSYEQIVLGDLVREFIKGDSDEAKAAKDRYDKGIPQPDEVATKLLAEKLPTIKSEGVVIDTYPLSVGQAQALDEITRVLGVYDLRVIFLNVGKDEIVRRIAARGQNRSDDKPEIAAKRYDEYEQRNAPIKEYYKNKGILLEVDGEHEIDAVHHDIAKKMGLDL
ncbi:MAG: nucleoside monophosphate kinase [Candidatus Doudnabacteria bacterium]|nr:nucleoside monophosphate kinase [Candidatus Doudnabacteria bacterium]